MCLRPQRASSQQDRSHRRAFAVQALHELLEDEEKNGEKTEKPEKPEKKNKKKKKQKKLEKNTENGTRREEEAVEVVLVRSGEVFGSVGGRLGLES